MLGMGLSDWPAKSVVVSECEVTVQMNGCEHESPAMVLRRLQESGAAWRVVSRTSSRVVIAFLTCDGGEEVDRRSFEEAEVREVVGDRVTSEG